MCTTGFERLIWIDRTNTAQPKIRGAPGLTPILCASCAQIPCLFTSYSRLRPIPHPTRNFLSGHCGTQQTTVPLNLPLNNTPKAISTSPISQGDPRLRIQQGPRPSPPSSVRSPPYARVCRQIPNSGVGCATNSRDVGTSWSDLGFQICAFGARRDKECHQAVAARGMKRSAVNEPSSTA